jgi:glucosamine-6-phosphate deaminase
VEVVIVENKRVAGRLVGDAVAALIDRRPEAVLGLATGSSPLPVYAELVRRWEAGEISFHQVGAFLLDEYVGLPADHPQRYRAFVAREFESRVDFVDGAVQGPDVDATNLEVACDAYEAAIAAAGGVDLQLLGIGTDGHIGFNEPGSSLGSRTRLKTLTGQTREDNRRFFAEPAEPAGRAEPARPTEPAEPAGRAGPAGPAEPAGRVDDGEGGGVVDVPRHVVTQGIGTILEARHLVLLAFGAGKAEAVAAAVEGPVTAMVPASALQFHPHATVVVDEAAAGSLRLADYYRATFTHKPAWQGL